MLVKTVRTESEKVRFRERYKLQAEIVHSYTYRLFDVKEYN